MDVTSLVVSFLLVGQAASDPFARPTTPLSAPPPNKLPTGVAQAAALPAQTAPSGAATIAEPSRYDRYPPAATGGARADYASPPYGTSGTAGASAPTTIVPVAGTEPSVAGQGTGAAVPYGGTMSSGGPPSSGPASSGGAMPSVPRGLSSAPPGGSAATTSPGAFSSGGSSAGSPLAQPQPLTNPADSRTMPPATNAAGAQTPAATAPEDTSGAADLVRESLVLPKSLSLRGTPVSLLEALSRTSDRRRQTAAVYAYWKLAGDLAEYHYAWQHQQFLKSLAEALDGIEQGADAQHARTAVASRQAEAAAELRESELRLAATQAELAAAAGLGAEEGGPLTRDLPHVGIYNTSFEKVYARRTPPARAYLLQRTLPLRHDVVSTRAQTVWAAQDAYEAAFDAYRKRQLPLDDVLLSVAELRERRSQFMVAVRRYNDEIAEYAFTSAPEGTSRETLVGMLIKSPYTPKLGKAVVPQGSDGIVPVTYLEDGTVVEPASFEGVGISSDAGIQGNIILNPDPVSGESIPTTGPSLPPPVNNLDETSAGAPVPPYVEPPAGTLPGYAPQPTRSAPPSGASTVAYWDALPVQLPPAAKPAEPNLFDAAGAQPLAAPSSIPATFQRGTPTLAPPREQVDAPLKFKVNRVPTEEPALLPHTSEAKPVPAAGDRSPYSSATHPAAPAVDVKTAEVHQDAKQAKTPVVRLDPEVQPAGFYNAVAGLPPARRAQELVEFLHRSAALPAEEPALKLTLDECLATKSSGERQAVITAYWRVAEAAATAQVWLQKLAQLDALTESTLRFRETPVGAVAMLEVRAAKLAAEGFLREARAELCAARWQLTDEMRKPLGQPWLMSVTLPHAGGYRTQIETASTGQSNTQATKLAGEIAALHEVLQLRAEAVATADQAAEQALQKYAAGQTFVHTPLNEFRRQTRSTNELLATVTRYNREIADYAMLMLPGGTSGDKLAGALVVDRTTTR